MADLLAVDGTEILFAEYVTAKAAKAGEHLRKRELALAGVPMCFVGTELEGFVASLPRTSYGMPQPSSPRMHGGEWVPRFYRGPGFQPNLLASNVRRGKVRTTFEVELPGLRLPEDTNGFLLMAITEWLFQFDGTNRGSHRRLDELQKAGWNLRLPRAAIGEMPFRRIGMSDSRVRLTNERSSLSVSLGSLPVRCEVRGTSEALDLLASWLSEVGLPLKGI